jgi:hypothetical protein
MARPLKQDRYQGEKKSSDLSLGWNSETKYDFLVFRPSTQSDHFEIVAEGAPLPARLLDVVSTFLQEVRTGWEMTWNGDTPGLQYTNRGTRLEEKLPRESIFHCQVESSYCLELCETRTKEKAHEMLLGDQPLEWWKKFGVVTLARVMVRPRVTRENEKKVMNKTRSTFTVTDTEGYSATVSFQAPLLEARKLLDLDHLNGTKDVTLEILPTLDPIRTSQSVSIGQLKRDALEYLVRFHKIRLQVKPEYQVWVTRQLLHLFESDETGHYVTDLKVSLVYASILERDAETRLASLVIYLQPGRICFEKVLTRLQKLFRGAEKEIGLDLPSRYNLQVNELLYYSQGDGDTKSYFRNRGILDKFFEAQTNYATVVEKVNW